MGIFGSGRRRCGRHPDAAGESGERRQSQVDTRAGRDVTGRRRLSRHLHRAHQPRADLCPGVRFFPGVRQRRDRCIGVRHRCSGRLRLGQSMGLEQPELESGVDPAAGPRLASSGSSHQAASRRMAPGWPKSPWHSSGPARCASRSPRVASRSSGCATRSSWGAARPSRRSA
jgi:hypothetical protein